jgi:hypothetical protein
VHLSAVLGTIQKVIKNTQVMGIIAIYHVIHSFSEAQKDTTGGKLDETREPECTAHELRGRTERLAEQLIQVEQLLQHDNKTTTDHFG